jgi:hypothetical protein
MPSQSRTCFLGAPADSYSFRRQLCHPPRALSGGGPPALAPAARCLARPQRGTALYCTRRGQAAQVAVPAPYSPSPRCTESGGLSCGRARRSAAMHRPSTAPRPAASLLRHDHSTGSLRSTLDRIVAAAAIATTRPRRTSCDEASRPRQRDMKLRFANAVSLCGNTAVCAVERRVNSARLRRILFRSPGGRSGWCDGPPPILPQRRRCPHRPIWCLRGQCACRPPGGGAAAVRGAQAPVSDSRGATETFRVARLLPAARGRSGPGSERGGGLEPVLRAARAGRRRDWRPSSTFHPSWI